MASEKLTNKSFTTTITGGVVWIQLPSGGGYEDHRILVSDLLNELTQNTQYAVQKESYTSQTSSFTHAVSEDDKIVGIDFRLNSGSCNIAVGTTPSGTEIIGTIALSASEDDNFNISKSFQSAATLYITITGTANINCDIWYRTGSLS